MQSVGVPLIESETAESGGWKYSLSPEEIDSMTLQVAGVAQDGILLASDTCMTEMTRARRTSLVSKIIALPEHKVFYAFAGDDCARVTGEDFEKRLAFGFNVQKIRDELQELGNSRWKAEKQQVESRGAHWLEADRRLSIVFYGLTTPELWQLRISGQSHASRCLDKVVAGDPGNTAIFFCENYCSDPARPGATPTVGYLKRLAAHVILMGHQRNNSQVEGLEVMTYRYGDAAPIRIDDEELRMLESFSKELDNEIRRRFNQLA